MANKEQFMWLVRMGIIDGREDFDKPMMLLTRVMRHSAVLMMKLWAMFKGERQGMSSGVLTIWVKLTDDNLV